MGPLKYQEIAAKEKLSPVKRQRVVFVLPTLMAGGAERVLITLMNTLDPQQFEPHLLVLDSKGTLADWIDRAVPVHCLGHVKIGRSVPVLARKLKALQPDIIVSTMAPLNFAVLTATQFLRKKPKIIVREAVLPSSIAENKMFPWLIKSAYKNLYRRADLIISPARCIIDEFQNYLGMDVKNHALLHNPVVIDRIRNTKEVLPRITNKRRHTINFLCAGRLHKQKGFDRLISALSGFKTLYDWSLTILGEGPERKILEALIQEHNLQDRVTLHGLSKNPWPIIGAADAFLLPSRWEGLPNVVLESLALGTPVIALREAGGIQEIASYTPKGALSLADSMDHFIQAMEHVQPCPVTSYRPSLLPANFELDAIVKRFSDLLEGKDAARFIPAIPETAAEPVDLHEATKRVA